MGDLDGVAAGAVGAAGDDGVYREVRGLVRGLDVLRALNAQPGGMGSVVALARATGLHRTTVKRLLATLEAQALVRREAHGSVYALTFEVRRLSEGYQALDWIERVARPAMHAHLRTLSWPSDLATPDAGFMIVRESTHPHSPLSQHRATIGFRVPVLLTALGRAWLAHCSADERAATLAALRQEDSAQGDLARDTAAVSWLLAETRRRGYAMNTGEWGSQPEVSAIACPVMDRGRAVAAINLVFMRSAMDLGTLRRRYAPQLRALAADMSEGLSASGGGA